MNKINFFISLITISVVSSLKLICVEEAPKIKPPMQSFPETRPLLDPKATTAEKWKDLSSEKVNWIDFKNIGDNPIVFGVHGVGQEGGGWFLWRGTAPNKFPKIDGHDLVTFQWKQRKLGLPKGFRDRDVIEGGKELAKLILKIYEKIKEREQKENKKIDMNLTIIAHSMGGNVIRVLLNLLDQQITDVTKKIKPTNIFEQMRDRIFRFVTKKTEPSIKRIVDTRFKENKGLIDTIKEGLTKNYYMDAYNEIFDIMKKLKEKGYEIKQPIIDSIYTLGTPYRKSFPFSLNMNPTKYFYALFSSEDEIQKKVGPARLKIKNMFDNKNNKFNIQVRFMEKGKIINPKHDWLIRNTSIIFKILEINKEKIFTELEKYLKKFEEEKKEGEKEKIKTLIVTFPEIKEGDKPYSIDLSEPLKFEFNTSELKKERFDKSGMAGLRF